MQRSIQVSKEPKRRGPRPKFDKLTPYQDGAPRLATRVDPDVLDWVTTRPEGTRKYVERVVRDDRARTNGGEHDHQAERPTVSTSPEDVPGQLLFGGQKKAKE